MSALMDVLQLLNQHRPLDRPMQSFILGDLAVVSLITESSSETTCEEARAAVLRDLRNAKPYTVLEAAEIDLSAARRVCSEERAIDEVTKDFSIIGAVALTRVARCRDASELERSRAWLKTISRAAGTFFHKHYDMSEGHLHLPTAYIMRQLSARALRQSDTAEVSDMDDAAIDYETDLESDIDDEYVIEIFEEEEEEEEEEKEKEEEEELDADAEFTGKGLISLKQPIPRREPSARIAAMMKTSNGIRD